MRASSLVCQSVIFGSVLAMSAVTGRKMWTARASSHSSLNPGHFGLRRAGLASGSHISCLGAGSGHRQIGMRAIDGGMVEVPLQWPCALRVGCELWRCEVKIPGVSSAKRWTKCPDAWKLGPLPGPATGCSTLQLDQIEVISQKPLRQREESKLRKRGDGNWHASQHVPVSNGRRARRLRFANANGCFCDPIQDRL